MTDPREARLASLLALEEAFAYELRSDRWSAAETAYALAARYRDACDLDKTREWAESAIELLEEFPSDSIDQVSTGRVKVGGVLLPDYLHADVIRYRFDDVLAAPDRH